MANETLNIVVEAKDNTRQGLASAERSLGGFGSVVTSVLQGVGLGAGKMLFDGIVGGIEKAAGVLPQLIMEGTQLGAVENTFQNLTADIGTTADAMIRELRPAARGMVSDAELMQAANKFMSMGLAETSEEAASLTEMATQLAIAMGKDATWGMESFALMLANQSIQRLDEFGISSDRVRQRIDELMEATEGLTREEAFKMAVFEEGAIAMERVGEQGDGAAAAMARLRSTFDNLKNAIALAAVPFVEKFAPVIQEFVDENAPKLFEWLDKIGKQLFGFKDQEGLMERWADGLREMLSAVSEGDWDRIFAPLEEWVDSGAYQETFTDMGSKIGAFLGDTIAAGMGDDEVGNAMARALGKSIARIPAMLSWVTWGAGAEIAFQILEAVGIGPSPEEKEMIRRLGYAGGIGALGVQTYADMSTGAALLSGDRERAAAWQQIDPLIIADDWIASGEKAAKEWRRGFDQEIGRPSGGSGFMGVFGGGLVAHARAQGVR